MVNIYFSRDSRGNEASPPDNYDETRGQLEIRWFEKKELSTAATADSLRAEYHAIKAYLPSGLAYGLFLCASPEAVESLLSTADAERPEAGSKCWRSGAPFLLAVAADSNPGLEDGHEEREWFKYVFKVAVETLVDELWPICSKELYPDSLKADYQKAMKIVSRQRCEHTVTVH